MRLSDFDFDLPEALIAQYPPRERSAGRLLDARRHVFVDALIRDLPELVRPGDLLVFNDTRVLKARFVARKETGGMVEILVERVLEPRLVQAMIRASHAPQPGSLLHLGEDNTFEVVGRTGEFYLLRGSRPVLLMMEQQGSLPLPPYIAHSATADDEVRYQTVYAKEPGAVAAPTAGLHFDQPLLDRLQQNGVGRGTLTLHVGAGTFLPVRHDDLSQHVMHAEDYLIPPDLPVAIAATRAAGGRIIAVGTTSLRALESAADAAGNVRVGAASTSIFITPGYNFRVVDLLFTNFHLPQSTLLMLVSAFAGVERIRASYAHAVASGYRFFSYGDAMLLERA